MLVLVLVLPLAIMAGAYAAIGREIWRVTYLRSAMVKYVRPPCSTSNTFPLVIFREITTSPAGSYQFLLALTIQERRLISLVCHQTAVESGLLKISEARDCQNELVFPRSFTGVNSWKWAVGV